MRRLRSTSVTIGVVLTAKPKAKVQLEKAVTQAAVRVTQAALPDKGPDDGLAFLLERIRGGKADE